MTRIRIVSIENFRCIQQLTWFPIFGKGADEASAVGKFTGVYVDAKTREKVTLTDGQKRAVEDLVVDSPHIERKM